MQFTILFKVFFSLLRRPQNKRAQEIYPLPKSTLRSPPAAILYDTCSVVRYCNDFQANPLKFPLLFADMSKQVEGIREEDLNVEELDVTSAVLMGGAHHLGNQCEQDFRQFMTCRYDTKDPRKCLEEGRKVSSCALEFFKTVKANCDGEFFKYWTCLDHNNQEFGRCRKPQVGYDSCLLDKLGWKTEQPVHLKLR